MSYRSLLTCLWSVRKGGGSGRREKSLLSRYRYIFLYIAITGDLVMDWSLTVSRQERVDDCSLWRVASKLRPLWGDCQQLAEVSQRRAEFLAGKGARFWPIAGADHV